MTHWINKYWFVVVMVVLLITFPIVADATATSITIYGTNRSNANSNITCGGCNNSIYVNAWNTSYVKNITVNSSNASGDVISFNISNVTAYQVQELKVNKTAVNAYQAGSNGMLNFSYTVVGNKTLTLSPAPNANGYNFTWTKIWAGGGFSNVVNVTTTYAAATVYQNTNGTAMAMTIGTQGSAWSYCRSENVNPPLRRTAWWVTGSATIIILPNEYYSCDWSGGAHNNWILWS